MTPRQPVRPVNRRRTTKRTGGEVLLQVRARRDKVRQQRQNRLFNIGCRFVLLVTIIGVLVWGGHVGMRKLFHENKDFTIREVVVKIDGSMSKEQVLDVAEIREGMNIFEPNLGEVRKRLEDLGRVQNAAVERHLPGKIHIHITERVPVAWLAPMGENSDPFTSPDSMLVDARGIAVKPGELQPEYLHLPIIYGIDTAYLMSGEAVGSPGMRAALDLLRLLEMHPTLTRFRIQSIDLRKGYCMVVSDARHARFTFGLDNLEVQLERLGALLLHSETTQREIETANLMLARNLPVKFVEVPVAEPVEPPKPAATTRSKTTRR